MNTAFLKGPDLLTSSWVPHRRTGINFIKMPPKGSGKTTGKKSTTKAAKVAPVGRVVKKQATEKKPSTTADTTGTGPATTAPITFNIESYFNAKKEKIDVFLVGNTKKTKGRFLSFMGGTYICVFKGKVSKPRNGDLVEDGGFDSIEEAKAHVKEKVLDALENKGYEVSTSPYLDDESESESEDEDTKFEHECNAYQERADTAEKKGHGAYIKFQREYLGITVAAMAKKLKTTKAVIDKLESGSEPRASDAILEELDNEFSTIFVIKRKNGWE